MRNAGHSTATGGGGLLWLPHYLGLCKDPSRMEKTTAASGVLTGSMTSVGANGTLTSSLPCNRPVGGSGSRRSLSTLRGARGPDLWHLEILISIAGFPGCRPYIGPQDRYYRFWMTIGINHGGCRESLTGRTSYVRPSDSFPLSPVAIGFTKTGVGGWREVTGVFL